MTVDFDNLVAYALGTLSPEASAEVERLLERDSAARAEVRAMQEGLTDMVLELKPVNLQSGAEDRLLARVRAQGEASQPSATRAIVSETPVVTTSTPQKSVLELPRERPRWILGAALGGLAAVIALAVVLPSLPFIQENRIQNEFNSYVSRPGAITQALLNSKGQSVGKLARLATGEVYVLLDKSPSSERVYQAWKIAKDAKPVSLGVYGGRNFLTSSAVAQGETFAVSVEPPGGSDQPSSAPVAVAQL